MDLQDLFDFGDDDEEDIYTILNREARKELKEMMKDGTLDVSVNGSDATDVDFASDEEGAVLIFTNDKGETTEIVISGGNP